MSQPKDRKLALILSAGGARAAYQVGVLKHLGTHLPNFDARIFTGISAGSINAAYLSQGQSVRESTQQMYKLWENLSYADVMRTNFQSFFSIFQRTVHDIFLSKFTKKHLLTSILNAAPLGHTLAKHISFPRITKAIRAGLVDGLAVSTTNYNTGENTVFFDSTEIIQPWKRQRRVAVRTNIRIRHIMASCSLPILFEPVRIGDHFYGDGALRFRFPLSPAIHLGASHILALGISPPNVSHEVAPTKQKSLSIGLVGGVVLNSIFVDSLETDYEHLCRINQIADTSPHFRHVNVIMICPSQDLGDLAKDHIEEVPFHFRHLLKATAMSDTELGDLTSYLMFTNGYIMALMDLGEKDAASEHDRIEKFLSSQDE